MKNLLTSLLLMVAILVAAPAYAELVKNEEPNEPDTHFLDFSRDAYDLMAGYGRYYHDGGEGSYRWLLARVQPFVIDKFDARVGLSFHASDGAHESPDGYEGEWSKFMIGVGLKKFGTTWSVDLDILFGVKNDKGSVDLYEAEQNDSLMEVALHHSRYGRRMDGKKLFSKFEVDLRKVMVRNVEKESAWDGESCEDDDPYDNASFELVVKETVYDIGGKVRLSPGVFGKYSNRAGDDPSSSTMLGGDVTLAINDKDIFNIGAGKYVSGREGHEIMGWVSIPF